MSQPLVIDLDKLIAGTLSKNGRFCLVGQMMLQSSCTESAVCHSSVYPLPPEYKSLMERFPWLGEPGNQAHSNLECLININDAYCNVNGLPPIVRRDYITEVRAAVERMGGKVRFTSSKFKGEAVEEKVCLSA